MLYPTITEEQLRSLYEGRRLSMMQISKELNCSHHKIAYWMNQYKIERRGINEAVYLLYNPNGDPFKIKAPKTPHEYILYGLGMGLYWGEGNKAHKNAVRLGNSDSALLNMYIQFLTKLCGVKKSSLKFQLQVFSDIDLDVALNYWCKALKVKKTQFFKPVVTISGSLGTYRKKNRYGVATIYFGNTKLRDILVAQIVAASESLAP
jgi:hypothetical protein